MLDAFHCTLILSGRDDQSLAKLNSDLRLSKFASTIGNSRDGPHTPFFVVSNFKFSCGLRNFQRVPEHITHGPVPVMVGH